MSSAITIPVRAPILQAIVELHAIETRGESTMESARRGPLQTAAELLEEIVISRFHHVTGVQLGEWLKRKATCVGSRGPVSVASAGPPPSPKERKNR